MLDWSAAGVAFDLGTHHFFPWAGAAGLDDGPDGPVGNSCIKKQNEQYLPTVYAQGTCCHTRPIKQLGKFYNL
ncbi:hypothetical protein Hanom_Chr08g00714401 [Helianthus anomalus]